MNKTHLSQDDLTRLRASLLQHREKIASTIGGNQKRERQVTDEAEPGDVAEQIIEQDEALRTVAFDAPVLADIDHALAKLDNGTYGVSEVSGEAIPLDRLTAVPWARRTVREEETHKANG